MTDATGGRMAMNPQAMLRVLPAIQHDKLYEQLEARGWRRVEGAPPADPHAKVVSTWGHDGIDARVSWVDDRELARHFYGIVYGPEAQRALERLVADAWAITAERGISAIQHATTAEQLGTAARALGLLAIGPFDQDVFDVLSGMLTSGHAALQLDALTGLMFSAWPQFEPAVASLAADEAADAAVRAEAADVLEAQRESGWNRELR
jgi:hypothetical protein